MEQNINTSKGSVEEEWKWIPVHPKVKEFFRRVIVYPGLILINLVFVPIQFHKGVFGSINKTNFYISLLYLACIFCYGILISFHSNRRPLVLSTLYFVVLGFLLLVETDQLSFLALLWTMPLTIGFYYSASTADGYQTGSATILFLGLLLMHAGYFIPVLVRRVKRSRII